MNIQAMMKQAQKLQKDMLAAQDEIYAKTYEVTKEFVNVKVKGTKQIEKISINLEQCDKDDIDMLEDLLLVALNEANKQIDVETNEKMGKYTQGMPGLF